MNIPSELLWPRQETLFLLIPALAHAGIPLTHNVARHCLKRVVRVSDDNCKISFENWFAVAREELKWNDSCIKLFWDNVHISSFKLNEYWGVQTDGIDFNYLAIFLVMHVIDDPPSSPKTTYDTAWPEDMNEVPSPLSPKSLHTARTLAHTLPKSPRSPQSSTDKKLSGYNKLIKRSRDDHFELDSMSLEKKGAGLYGSRLSKTAFYSLNSIRSKMPAILKALALEYDTEGEVSGVETTQDFLGTDLMISRRAVNSLGIIVTGGFSREEAVYPLAGVLPQWRSRRVSEVTDDKDAIHCAQFLAWFNSHLCMNDVVYPSSSLPSHHSRATPNLTALLIDSPPESGPGSSYETNSSASLPVAPPIRVLESLSTLSAARPTALVDFHSSTYLHVVTSGPILRKMSSVSMDTRSKPDSSSAMSVGSEAESTTPNTSDCMSEGGETGSNMLSGDSETETDNYTVNAVAEKDSSGLSDIETERGSIFGDREKPGIETAAASAQSDLPQLVIKGCTRSALYFLSPFSSATIVDCQDCDIIIGPVAGIVVVNNCIKNRISVVCRKLLVKSSVDCSFFLATLAASLISGDCVSIQFSPYNTCYRHLKVHMDLAELSILYSIDSIDLNLWASYCDVKSLLELPIAIGSPSGYTQDATRQASAPLSHMDTLPRPPEHVANILSPQKYKFISIPYRSEYKDYKASFIGIPSNYLLQLDNANEVLASIRNTLVSSPMTRSPKVGAEELDHNELSSYLSSKFIDWLVHTNKIQQILDLIRIDVEAAEKVSKH